MGTEKLCRGLVLAGGGARGSYQVGVWRALDELGWKAGVVTGTSVGCLNGAMYVLGQYETARDMWLSIRSKDVMELPAPGSGLEGLGEAVRQFVARGRRGRLPSGGHRAAGAGRKRAAGLPHPVRTGDGGTAGPAPPPADPGGDPPGQGCGLPAGLGGLLPRHPGPGHRRGQIHGRRLRGQYARRPGRPDGGHRAGLRGPGGVGHHPAQPHRSAHHPDPQPLGTGGHPAVRSGGGAAEHRAGLLRHPAGLRAAAGGRLCHRPAGQRRGCGFCSGPGWTPCRKPCGGAGRPPICPRRRPWRWPGWRTRLWPPWKQPQRRPAWDPARMYTVEELGQAFLAQCDHQRLSAFDPLFDGSGSGALAARAALLPHLYLQALVRRALTGPYLPEVIT